MAQTHALVNQKCLRAMAMLRSAPEFEVFVDCMKAQRDQVRASIEIFRGNDDLQRAAGGSSEISDMLDIIDRSQVILAKLMQAEGAKY